MELEERLVSLLIEKKYHICCAESCTGGLLSARIINVANASKVLNMGFITYSNESKEKLIGVNSNTIIEYGVVSEEVAKEMAIGASFCSNSEIGVGITGIAGPSGGTLLKPVGTVCFGIKICDQIYSYTMHFANDTRNVVREKSVVFVVEKIISILEK